MEAARELQEKECPQCKEMLPVNKGFVTWCHKCNWNLISNNDKKSETIFEKVYTQLGRKFSHNLLQSMLKKNNLETRFSVSRLLTLIVASIVHLLSLLFFLSGCILILTEHQYIPEDVLGVFLIVLAWVSRPRITKLNTELLPKEKFPSLYTLVNDISSAIHTEKIYGIVVDDRFNASFTQVSWRRRKIIRLGLPLVTILNKQELVALISHELAHGVNGDLNRTFLVGSAINTLSSWYHMIKPTKIFDSRYRAAAFVMILANIFLLFLSKIIYLILYVLCHLGWGDSQRAEFLADQYAAKVSGKEATISLLDKLHFGDLFQYTVLKYINNKKSGAFFEYFLEQVRNIPTRELERIRRVEYETNARLDVTHPPTVNRISLIDSLKTQAPLYDLSQKEHQKLLVELSNLKSPIEAQLVDFYKSRVLGY